MDTVDLVKKIRSRSAQRREIMCEYGDQDDICDLLDAAADQLEALDMAVYISKAQNSLYREALYDDCRG
jgi:hypothetical protein